MGYPRNTAKRDASIAADAAHMSTRAIAKKYLLGQRQVQIILSRVEVTAQRSPRSPRPKSPKWPRMLEALEAEYDMRR
jgi:hypothetical protein